MAIDPSSFVEPVEWADDVPETDEDVWSHCWMESLFGVMTGDELVM
jgi:hypothetical protein